MQNIDYRLPDAGMLAQDESSPGEDREEVLHNRDILRQAVALIILERKASPSYLQRRLRIGYNRAAEIIGELEKRKLVSPVRDDGKREILANFSQE